MAKIKMDNFILLSKNYNIGFAAWLSGWSQFFNKMWYILFESKLYIMSFNGTNIYLFLSKVMPD